MNNPKCILFCFIILLSSSCFSQPKKLEISLGTGVAIPSAPNEFRDIWNLDYSYFIGEGEVSYRLNKSASIGFNISYNQFAFDKSAFLKEAGITEPPSSIITSGGSVSTMEFLLVSRYYFPISKKYKIDFYQVSGFGAGYSIISDLNVRTINSAFETIDGTSETDFMLTLGVGIKFPASKIHSFIEGRFSLIFDVDDENLSYFPLRVGIIF